MAYVVTYDDNARPAETAGAALEMGEMAEAEGFRSVMVESLSDGVKLPLDQFALRYCNRSKVFGNA